MQASGDFDVELTTQKHDSIDTGRILIKKKYRGGMQGRGEGQMLSHRSNVEGSAGYVAIEHFKGAIDGREGSLRFLHTGIMDRGEQSLTVTIIPDSGTAGLRGISGTLKITMENQEHKYIFDYALPQ